MPKNQTQHGATAKARGTAAAGRSRPSARPRVSASASRALPKRLKTASKPTKPTKPGKASPRSKGRDRSPSPRPANAASPFRTLRWWLLPAGVLVALALFVLGYYPVARVQYQAVCRRALLRAELTAIQARNQRLAARVARLETTEGVEAEARERLGLVKKGETLGVVIDGDETRAVGVPPRIDSDGVAAAPTGPWTAFLDAVFGVSR